MNEDKTVDILQRVPKILAVTAASYGLDAQGRAKQKQPHGETRAADGSHGAHGRRSAAQTHSRH
jgi:hypothetical protein